MADKLTLYVCNINEEGPPSSRGLQASPTSAPRRQHDFDKIVFARDPVRAVRDGTPAGAEGVSGQEKLPVLRVPDGRTVNGSAEIIAWTGNQAR